MGIFMMVLNAEDCLLRCLAPFAGHCDELSIVDTGSTDHTLKLITHIAKDILKVPLRLTTIHPAIDKHLYMPDASETWSHHLPGPFTNQPMLVNWSNIQNMAMDALTTKYGLRLDADDTVINAPGWKTACNLMEAHPHVDMISCPYRVQSPKGELNTVTAMPRLFRLKSIRYHWPMHEQPRPRTDDNHFFCADGLTVIDHNDSVGKVRICFRNAKVLYKEYLNHLGVDASSMEPEFEFTVGHEMVDCEPELALTILELCNLQNTEVDFHKARAYENLSKIPDRAFSMKLDVDYDMSVGQWEAKALYESIIKREPSNINALSKLSKLYAKVNMELAIDTFVKARNLARDAKYINVWLPYLWEAASELSLTGGQFEVLGVKGNS